MFAPMLVKDIILIDNKILLYKQIKQLLYLRASRANLDSGFRRNDATGKS